jgi:hypothetical protein
MRIGLVVWTLLSFAVGTGVILAWERDQADTAEAILHAQDLRDLRAQVAQANAAGLIWAIDPSDDPAWTAYQQASDQVADLLVRTAANSGTSPHLNEVSRALRAWQDAVAGAHAALDPTAIADITAHYQSVTDILDTTMFATGSSDSSWRTFTAVGIVASCLSAVGFVVAGTLTARRTHRVVNIGLTLGLLAVIGAIVVISLHASQSLRIQVAEQSNAALSQAQADLWDARSQASLAVLDPAAGQDHANQAQALADRLTAGLADEPPMQVWALSLSDHVDQIAGDLTAADRAPLVLDAAPWQDAANAIADQLDVQRPVPDALVVPALVPVISLAGLCLVAIVATLAGIHTRVQEYV